MNHLQTSQDILQLPYSDFLLTKSFKMLNIKIIGVNYRFSVRRTVSSILEDKLKIWRTSGHFGGHLEDEYKIEINSSKISCSYINITVPALETIKCSLLPFKKLNIQAWQAILHHYLDIFYSPLYRFKVRRDLIHLLAEMENNTLLYWLGLGGSYQQEKYNVVALSTVS